MDPFVAGPQLEFGIGDWGLRPAKLRHMSHPLDTGGAEDGKEDGDLKK